MKYLFPLLFLIALFCCACSSETPVRFTCANGQQLDITYIHTQAFKKAEIQIVGKDSLIELSQVPSGSGVKYSNSQFTWHTQEQEGYLSKNDALSSRVFSQCVSSESMTE